VKSTKGEGADKNKNRTIEDFKEHIRHWIDAILADMLRSVFASLKHSAFVAT
jgi:hypothetical protein